jgi:uncharacterized protein (DUF2062 family)
VLFDRRVKRTFAQKARNFVWPQSGLRRSTRYLTHRIQRMPGTPYAIAAGFACGAAVSMTPFPGFHFLISALLAWILRGSIVVSAIGTVVGNPWTFPFIWLWLFNFGNWILGTSGDITGQPVTMGYLWDHPFEVLLPMMVGSIPTALVTWLAFYWPIRRMVAAYQAGRRARLETAANRFREGRVAK